MKPLTPSQRFATFVMKGPREAIASAMLLSAMPFVSWLSVVIVALVTLRQGMKQGFRVLIWAVLPVVAIGAYQHDISAIWETITYSFLLTWGMACMLRYSSRWEWVVTLGVVLSILALSALLLLAPGYPETLLPRIKHLYQVLYDQELTSMPVEKAQVFLFWLSKFLPGVQSTFIVISALFNLLIARALQASLYHVGGLKKELLAFRVHKLYGLLVLISAIGLWANLPIAGYVLVVVLLPFVLAGLSFIHWFVERFQKGRLLTLILMYFLLCMFLPMSLAPIVVLSLLDVAFDLRTHLGKSHKQSN